MVNFLKQIWVSVLLLVAVTALVLHTQPSDVVVAQESGSQDNTSAIDEIKTTIDDVVRTNAEYSGDAKKAERRAELRKVINPRFDFEEMSRRSLGANWGELSSDQQTQFVSLFSELLTKTYIAKIETATKETVTIGSETVEMPRAYIKTMVLYKGDKFPLDYKLILKNGDWKVYDVLIENIGLVGNYRNEFAGIIRKDGATGLISMLQDKIKKLG